MDAWPIRKPVEMLERGGHVLPAIVIFVWLNGGKAKEKKAVAVIK